MAARSEPPADPVERLHDDRDHRRPLESQVAKGADDLLGSLSAQEVANIERTAAPASNAAQFQAYRRELAQQEIQGAEAVGSALKSDPYHRSASFPVEDIAEHGSVFTVRNRTGQVNLTQVPGVLNGMKGRFEWIVDAGGQLTHQMFVKDGRINGEPIKP